YANLSDAKLSRAKLSHASLDGANLTNADLVGVANEEHLARLKQGVAAWNAWRAEKGVVPDLNGADLATANLRHAGLSDAKLGRAKLSHASLTGASLSRASFNETFFTNVDLSNVLGLDRCEHYGPSSIDHRTLEKSPNLPLAFLRGVG